MGQSKKRTANESSDPGNPLELGGQRKWFIHIPRGRGFHAASRLQTQEASRPQGCTHNQSENRGSLQQRDICSLCESQHIGIELRERVRGQRKEKTVQGLNDRGSEGEKVWVLVPDAYPDNSWAHCPRGSTQSAVYSFPIPAAAGPHFYARQLSIGLFFSHF